MKKLLYICLSAAIITVIASCGNKKKDSDLKTQAKENTTKMLKLHKDYADFAIKAAKDTNLNDEEILELNKIAANIEKFSKEIEDKYEKDSVAQDIMMQLLKTEENKKIIKEYNDALLLLYRCDGSEYLTY
jgi:outer membrane murein-binding lipoprotein Lpp